MSSRDEAQNLQLALSLHRSGRIAEAEKLYRKIIKWNPKQPVALHSLGIIEAGGGNLAEAARLMARSLSVETGNIQFMQNYATVLCQLKQYETAAAVCVRGLQTDRGNVYLLYVLAGALLGQNKLQEALSRFDELLSRAPNHVAGITERGSVLLALKRYDDALAAVERAIAIDPRYAEAHLNRGTAYGRLRRHEEAIAAFDRALQLNPGLGNAWLGYGNVLSQLKRHDEALAAYDRVLSLTPNSAQAWAGRGNVFFVLKRYDEALAAYDRALSLDPGLAQGWLGRGNVLFDLKRHDEAFAAYDRAVSIDPELADIWVDRGNVLFDLGRHDEALAAHEKALLIRPESARAWAGRGDVFFVLKRFDEAIAAFDRALSLDPDLAQGWLGRGNVLFVFKRYEEACAAQNRALSIEPDFAKAWLGLGNVFLALDRHREALVAYDRALSLDPDLAQAWLGRGNLFFGLRRHDEAMADYDRAVQLKPDLAEAWLGRGYVFANRRRYDESFAACDRAFSLDPHLAAAEGERIFARLHLCDWNNLEAECEHLVQSVRSGKDSGNPLAFMAINSSIDDQLGCARLWTRRFYSAWEASSWRGDRYRHDKIRIGYVSADFCQHPVANLVAGVFESHDRSRFEITGISIGLDDKSEIRQRLEHSFDRFIDAAASATDEIARQIKQHEIDILVDMNGFTQNSRTLIFAGRHAPVQVNYLGYPGTMGADFIDYIVGDAVLIPPSHQRGYAEKVVYLPGSYLPHDGKSRAISERVFQRADFGLPDDGFVFCCFNNASKLNPALFRSRMKLLKAVERSVLWLSENNATAAANLRKEAAAAGVDPDRLVFAGRVPSMADHLARHRLADLFLDTLPYNAHTTASDALWAGLPVLTQIGETFAGRVAASLLTAIGLPELIAQTEQQFESSAIELATRPERLAAIRERLAHNRLTMPLFDTQRYTRHIESAFATMHERHQNGVAPDHIYVLSGIS